MVTGYCENCGQPIHDGDAFCMNCGVKVAAAAPQEQQRSPVSMPPLAADLPSPSVCPNCGMPVVEGDAFCMNCGTKIGSSSIPAQPEANSIPMPNMLGGQPTGNVCQNCGGPLAEGDLFCMNCGTKVVSVQSVPEQPAAASSFGGIAEDGFCPECGNKTWAGWAFCMNCGQSLEYTFPVNQVGAQQVPQQSDFYGAGAMDSGFDEAPMQPDFVPAQPVPAVSEQPSVAMTGTSFAGQDVAGPANEPSPVRVRTVSIMDFGDNYAAPMLDNSLGMSETNAGFEPDDSPTTVYDEEDDDVLTMVYSDETHPTCTLTRVSTGDVLTLELPAKLGRGTAATVRIKGNPFVGRVHAQVIERDGQVFVIDEGSANHTFVNGKELAPHEEAPLADGDVLALAKEEFNVHIS